MDFIDDAQDGDTTTLLIIAGAVLIVTSFACLICNRTRTKKIVDGCWRLAAEGYGRKLSTANAAFQGAYDVRIDPSVISSVCQSADAAYRTRNSAALSPDAPIGPSSGTVKSDPNQLRRQVCEWPAIYAPIADIALNVFSDFSRTLAMDGFLVHFDSNELGGRVSDGEHGPAHGGDSQKHPVDPSTRKQRQDAVESACCHRCCCVCADMEVEALNNAEDVLANLVAKAFLTHLGKRATPMTIRFAARGWVHPSLISVAKAVEQRLTSGTNGGGGDAGSPVASGLDQELGDLSPTDAGRDARHRAVVLACSPREDEADATERFMGGDLSSDLYLRTCVDLTALDGAFDDDDNADESNPAVKVAKAVRLRSDLVEFLTALQAAIEETAAPDSLKVQHWMYRGVDAVDRNLSAALYRRRSKELQTALGHWESGVVSALEGMLTSSTDALKLQAIEGPDLSRQASAIAEVGSPSRVTDQQLRRFLDDFFERAEAQYSAAFKRDPDHDDHGTVASCCGNCLPELPHVRRIKSGEDVLREHLMQRVTAAAAKDFAVAPAHRDYAARLLSELKADALNRILGAPAVVSDDDVDDADVEEDDAEVRQEDVSLEWSDDGNGDGVATGATPGSASRRRRRRQRRLVDEDGPGSPLPGESYTLPDIAYEWLPRHLVPTLGAVWSDAVDAATHRVSERTMGGIAKLEDELAVLVASRDAGFSRMEAEVIDSVRDAAAPHIRELAHAATVLKTVCRFSRDACITARQGAVNQLTRVLLDLREFLETLLSRPALADYRSWLPLGQIVRSFNAHAAKCPHVTPIADTDVSGVDTTGGADDVAPTPPPRSDI